MKTFKINGYEIQYNPLWKHWIISHLEIGAGIAEFSKFNDAVDYCING